MPTDNTLFTAVVLFVLVPLFAYLILIYVLQALGLSKLAKRRGIHHPWLAWIPGGRDWLLGCLSDQYQYVSSGKVRYNRRWLLGISIPTEIINALIYLLFILGLPLMIASPTFDGSFEEILMASPAPALGYTLYSLTYLLSIGLIVFRSIAHYNLFSSSIPRFKVILLIVSILVERSSPFIIFGLRDYDHGMPPRHQTRSSVFPPYPETQG